jgi:hypothetical protein
MHVVFVMYNFIQVSFSLAMLNFSFIKLSKKKFHLIL